MAAAIQILKDSKRETIVKLTNDGTTESAVLKIDASALNGAIPDQSFYDLKVSELIWSVTNDASVALLWDATSDVTIAELNGSGTIAFHGSEMFTLNNNGGAGVTGDILLTTRNWGATKTYTVIIKLLKNTGYDRGGDPTVAI